MTGATLTIDNDDDRGFAFDPAALVAAAGSPTSYTVALTSMPARTVTVSISPGGAALTVSASRLTFVPTAWKTAQTVTAGAYSGDTALRLAHSASGGDYDEVAQDPWVARTQVASVVSGKPPGTYIVNGQPVVVSEAAGVPPAYGSRPRDPSTG